MFSRISQKKTLTQKKKAIQHLINLFKSNHLKSNHLTIDFFVNLKCAFNNRICLTMETSSIISILMCLMIDYSVFRLLLLNVPIKLELFACV